MRNLDAELTDAMKRLKIEKRNRESLLSILTLLGLKHKDTRNHSIRVALLGEQIAKHMHLDPKVLFYAGLIHDSGKIVVDPSVLVKTEGFSVKDMKLMRVHPLVSWEMWRGIHDYSAEVVLYHHKFQKDAYPKKLPPKRMHINFGAGTKAMIMFYARLLALIDFYDAITSRVNDKFGEKRKLTKEEAKTIMLANNIDQKGLINDLYDCGIFGA